ncbi:hypothetical protein ACWC0C_38860 [Streptomyces sp. NPDC001709]
MLYEDLVAESHRNDPLDEVRAAALEPTATQAEMGRPGQRGGP